MSPLKYNIKWKGIKIMKAGHNVIYLQVIHKRLHTWVLDIDGIDFSPLLKIFYIWEKYFLIFRILVTFQASFPQSFKFETLRAKYSSFFENLLYFKHVFFNFAINRAHFSLFFKNLPYFAHIFPHYWKSCYNFSTLFILRKFAIIETIFRFFLYFEIFYSSSMVCHIYWKFQSLVYSV